MHTPRPRLLVHLTADIVILTIRAGSLQALLVERGTEPFRGRLALPGGFLRGSETLDLTAIRELREETGMDAARFHLEQIGIYSDPHRDPRDPRVISCSYLAIVPDPPVPAAGSDAAAATWAPVESVLATADALAFDHHRILRDAVEHARFELQFSAVATQFCPPEFTIAELRKVYETVWGHPLDGPNFHRKVTEAAGFLTPVGRRRKSTVGRPAALYRAGDATMLTPPIMRPP
ncbi:NUDIX domain-containing protein [Streptomyces sp. NPDC004610]|uniref:NUDIX hydrolase n=1 Tax=unclassified Streptomyces TaxID=2593676 RepID=UPI0033AB7087